MGINKTSKACFANLAEYWAAGGWNSEMVKTLRQGATALNNPSLFYYP
jgi:hypothetical protein